MRDLLLNNLSGQEGWLAPAAFLHSYFALSFFNISAPFVFDGFSSSDFS